MRTSTVDAGGATGGDQPVEVLQRHDRRASVGVVVGAQHREQAGASRSAPRGTVSRSWPATPAPPPAHGRTRRGRCPPAPRRAHRVGDHVMQLAGDAQPLLGDRRAGQLVTRGGQLVGPPGVRRRLLAAAPAASPSHHDPARTTTLPAKREPVDPPRRQLVDGHGQRTTSPVATSEVAAEASPRGCTRPRRLPAPWPDRWHSARPQRDTGGDHDGARRRSATSPPPQRDGADDRGRQARAIRCHAAGSVSANWSTNDADDRRRGTRATTTASSDPRSPARPRTNGTTPHSCVVRLPVYAGGTMPAG